MLADEMDKRVEEESTLTGVHGGDGVVAITRLIRVINPNYSNPKDIIAHRVLPNERDSSHLTSSYYNNFQHHLLERYSNERSQSYSSSMNKHREMQVHYGK